MSLSCQSALRVCARAARASPARASVSRLQQARRWQSTDAAAAPANPKIATIVDQISQLTLLETADLVSTLKTRLNIPDMPVGGFAAAPAAAQAAAPAAAEEEEAAPAAQEKTLFNLKLQSIDTASKPKIIKEVKSMLGLSLVDSKKFVESAPKLMKESVPKEEAEKIIETMKGLGAVVVME
ncbi:putative 50s ribosomal protein l12 protein [Lasiodiplodia theobromae]|uniref:54S ribosomal protein L12 n=2 Tax=Lasiodiplodia TaxID=66739 RepID=A0A5N5DA98_9PEZI|nr:Mitochondrial 54s ribosomal protein [Lasiodiplodia theobromae]KAB2574706.1 54S ribosomal protein L12 [Lasiodiplodia theobromae]KAF4538812.1 Mitochondrial 54s ribosomal protein [Lasiodiplodia theobromae]KAF9637500.1 putative 50s ribosomal protein l12 protein [Lasiodiplodia theobromae]KAK0644998.1 54S ribosomal protein L12 [Lasiodiplodia hormozganensis]